MDLLTLMICLVWMHTLADFWLQTDWQAQNKSKRLDALTLHVVTYLVPFAVVLPIFFGYNAYTFIVFNAIMHWVTDFTTSRVASWAWKENKRGLFFGIIGIDQALHYTTLLVSIEMLYR